MTTVVPTDDDVLAALAGDVLTGVVPSAAWSLLLEHLLPVLSALRGER